MDQIVNWLDLFQQAHTTLVQFVTALGVALVSWASLDLVFIGYRKFREVCVHLSGADDPDNYWQDPDSEHGGYVVSDDGIIEGYENYDTGAYYPSYGDEGYLNGVDSQSGESIYGFEDDPV